VWFATLPVVVSREFDNVVRGEALSIRDLDDMIDDVLCVPLEPGFASPRNAEVRPALVDVSRFVEQAGFRDQIGLRERLAAMTEHSTAKG
jgi:nucleoside-diphosphate-sugar epimerase